MEVSRSGYYAFKVRPKSLNRINNDKLLIEIRRVFWDNNRNYGSPRIWDQSHNKEQIPYEIIGSMSKKGDCWDNAVAESFFHTLKVEIIYRNKFRTRDEAKKRYSNTWKCITIPEGRILRLDI